MKLTTSIVIVNFNTAEITSNCIKSVLSFTSLNEVEIIVVDNDSSDNSIELLTLFGDNIKLIRNSKNLGFSGGNNVGIRVAKGEYILLLNSDTLIHDDIVSKLSDFLQKNRHVGAISPMLLNKDQSIQKSYYSFPKIIKSLVHLSGLTNLLKFNFGKSHAKNFTPTCKVQNEFSVDYCIFAAVMIRKSVFNEIGLLDEDLFFYHEDCEFGLRMAKAKLNFYYLPSLSLTHLGGASSILVQPLAFENFFTGLSIVYQKHYSSLHSYAFHFFALPILFFLLIISLVPGINLSKPPSDYLATGEKRNQHTNPQKTLKKLFIKFFRVVVPFT